MSCVSFNVNILILVPSELIQCKKSLSLSIYIYNNRQSREKIKLNFKLEFNYSLILHHVSHLI